MKPKQPKKVKVVQLRMICKDENGNKLTRLIDEKKLNEMEMAFQDAGGSLFKLLMTESYESKIILN